MEKRILFTVILGVLLTMIVCATATETNAQSIIIDHNCTDVSQIPEHWVDQAKQLTIHYGHTSHGSQITDGLENLETLYPNFTFARNESGTEGLPPVEVPPALRIYDGNPPETYIEPDDYWNGTAGLNRTRAVANTGNYDFSMWAWCGQLSWYSNTQVQNYLGAMNQLETEYPGMRFIYMTGHLDGTGSSGALHANNQMIRQYCQDNNKVLFDFADIESYDPDGTGYLDQAGDDYCNYTGGNWANEWCAANPSSDLCDDCTCQHSRPLNCNQKARAFWWMMARLAGWDGAPAGPILVNAAAAGANDGTSWADAYPNLQSALNVAVSDDEIWVASGFYTPVRPGSPGVRADSFQMKNGVGIYGGFPNVGSPTWEDRAWYSNPTVLSGEIGNPGTINDNCYHLFYNPGSLDVTAILDGFTITEGNADGDHPHSLGGGMYNYESSPTVTNCNFFGNFGEAGGGMRNEYSSPTMTNCTFFGNSANLGGGMYNWRSSCPVITNCTFYGNQAGDGGGIRNHSNSSPIITNTILWGDWPDEILNYTSSPSITYSNIQGGYPGVGNISGTPMFVNPGIGDFHLIPSSPCINAGTNLAPNLPTEDFEGNSRILNGIVDMGIDEFNAWSPWIYDTNHNLVISKQEALQAVVDFFAGLITKQQALQVIVLFFS